MTSKSRMVVEGFDDFDDILADLSKGMAKAAMVRTLKRAAAPIQERARELAPKRTLALEESIHVGTKLTRRQATLARQTGKGFAEVYVGTADPAGIAQEFGTFKEPAQPFMRPAWDAKVGEAATIIRDDLREEFERTAARARKRKAKAGK